MIEEKKNVIFLAKKFVVISSFELRFEIKGTKIRATLNFSLIHRKTKKQQRPSTFLVVATHQTDDYFIKLFYQFEKIFIII